MNNALNLFPTTTTAPNAHHKLQQLLYRHSPTCAAPTEVRLLLLLLVVVSTWTGVPDQPLSHPDPDHARHPPLRRCRAVPDHA